MNAIALFAPFLLSEDNMDIYIAPTANNEELGTAEQPYAANSTGRFEELMRQHAQRGNHVHIAAGHYKTGPTGQWNRKPGRGFTINGEVTLASEAVVELDVDAFTPEDITAEPKHMFIGQGVWDDPDRSPDEFSAMTPEAVFDALPRGQKFRGGTLIGNHSKLMPLHKAAGCSYSPGAVLLNGHNTAIEGTRLVDFGAYRNDPNIGAEAFPLVLSIATSGFDQNKLAQLDMTKYMVDVEGEPSHIINTKFDGYNPAFSNEQVTVRMIVGSFGEPGGFGTGNWQYMWRRDCYQENNTTGSAEYPIGPGLVQAHTNYLAKSGRVRGNKSYGADVLYYGDYLQTERQLIDLNEAYNCRTGIALLLSPGPPTMLARNFYHKDYTLGLNKIESRDAQVLIRTLVAEWEIECKKAGQSTENSRFITGIKVDRSLTVNNEGGVTIPVGVDLKTRRGCL